MILIETERLRLREMRPGEDAPFILELLNEPGFVRFVGDKGVRTLEDADRYIDKQLASCRSLGFGLLTVETSPSGDPIGICGLLRRDPIPDVEVGFGYLESAHGKGYAIEAARATLEWGFREHGLPRIVAITAPDNEGSINVLQKLGMSYRSLVSIPGFDVDRMLFSIDATLMHLYPAPS